MPESLMAVVNETLADAPSSHREIARVCETCGYHVGASPVFSDIMELPSHYGAAMVAARSADTPGEIVDFDDIKLPYALSVLRLDSVADVRHSALAQLAAYDAAHGTELLETLRCYVENRGSYVRTYERLFIHRSTLQYRLERIAELCGIDFSDPDAWLHLQLSFALDG